MYLTQGLHRSLQQHPDRPAVYSADRSRTFRELAERVARLASGLRGLGMANGDRVAILALNSDRYLEYQLAVPWGGGVLNPCNTRWSATEIAYSLRDCTSTILIVDDSHRHMVEAICRDAPCVREVVYAGDGATPLGMHGYEQLIAASEPIADTLRRGTDLLGVFYTGGTTGHPKGVMLSHANVVVSALALLSEGVSMRGGVYLHAAPMFHIADFGVSLPHHLVGNAHAFLPAWSPVAMLECVARARVTDVLLVPTMLQMLTDQLEIAGACQLHSLERLMYGASTISEPAILRAMAALPNVEFFQGYGMTELAPLGTLNGAWYHSVEGRKAGKLRAAGRASLCTEVRIADEQGHELPRDEVGEVLVRGPNVMLGYWNDPKQTDAALRDGWMHTGDCARMDVDGFIYIVDRIKDMIKSGGENVFSAEVEKVLAQHPAVSACAVIGVPNEKWGESVHAAVVTKPGSSISGLQLIDHCRQHIAAYKCPRSIEFRQSLPLSGAGKVLKTVLRKPFWEGRDCQVA